MVICYIDNKKLIQFPKDKKNRKGNHSSSENSAHAIDAIDGRKVTDRRRKKRIAECLQEGEGIATRRKQLVL